MRLARRSFSDRKWYDPVTREAARPARETGLDTTETMGDIELSPSADGEKEEEEEAVAVDDDEGKDDSPPSDVKTADKRRARDGAEGIDAAVEVTTRSQAIDALCKAMPAHWKPQPHDLLVAKLRSPNV
eukprot:4848790-Prymnesium_polylepis.1